MTAQALICAARSGNFLEVSDLLNSVANPRFVRVTNNKRETALMVASERGHINVVAELLQRDSSRAHLTMERKGGHLNTALTMAAVGGHADIVRMIVQAAGPNAAVVVRQRDAGSATPLMWAALNDHEQVIAELLAVDVTEQHILHVSGPSLKSMEDPRFTLGPWYVLRRGWEKVAVVPEGLTAMEIAEGRGHMRCARLPALMEGQAAALERRQRRADKALRKATALVEQYGNPDSLRALDRTLGRHGAHASDEKRRATADVALRAVMKLNAYDAMVALRSLSYTRDEEAFQELYEKVRTRYAEERNKLYLMREDCKAELLAAGPSHLVDYTLMFSGEERDQVAGQAIGHCLSLFHMRFQADVNLRNAAIEDGAVVRTEYGDVLCVRCADDIGVPMDIGLDGPLGRIAHMMWSDVSAYWSWHWWPG